MIDTNVLADIFRKAEAAAIAADPKDDGGTCNFDSPAFRIDKVRDNKIQEAATKSGVSVHSFSWWKRRWYMLRVTMHGQGNQRTTMMEAALNVLKQESEKIPGMQVCGYYAMD